MPPFSILERYPNDSAKSYTSSYPDMVYWLLKAFHMTYSILPDNLTEVAIMGSINSALYNVAVGNVDIGTGLPMISVERKKLVDFSHPMWIAPFKLIGPKPGEQSRVFALIKPFEPMVWLVLFILLVVVTVTARLFVWIYLNDGINHASMADELARRQRNDPLVYTFKHYIIYTVSILSNHGSYSASISRQSMKVLIAAWLLASTVLVNSYAGIVISALMVPSMIPPIESLEDLVKSDDITIAVQKETIPYQQYMAATNGTYKKVGDQLRRHPEGAYLAPSYTLPTLLTMKHAIPTDDIGCMYMMYLDLKDTGKCRFHIGSEATFRKHDCLTFRRDWKYTKAFSDKILVLWETGLNWYFKKKPVPGRVEECVGIKRPSTSNVPITLGHLTSAFVILGIGVALSILAFAFEVIAGSWGKKNRINSTSQL